MCDFKNRRTIRRIYKNSAERQSLCILKQNENAKFVPAPCNGGSEKIKSEQSLQHTMLQPEANDHCPEPAKVQEGGKSQVFVKITQRFRCCPGVQQSLGDAWKFLAYVLLPRPLHYCSCSLSMVKRFQSMGGDRDSRDSERW